MSITVSKRTLGVNFNNSGQAEIVVWAPLATSVNVHSGEYTQPLTPEKYGYWRTTTGFIAPGSLYTFSINNGKPFPDPASLSQPEGVHGPSAASDLRSFRWSDDAWKNIPLKDYIIYELHTGTFTPENNFDGIIGKLDYLADLGITAIEIMPVGQFPGNRNWGYDGVYPFAVQHSYGGAAALHRLVDACHRKNIAVILDVIYNHLGPEGNYLPEFGPYFTEKYKTPWGKALNFDDAWCNGVRDYVTENALMWFRDFHIDALRMDAVHAIRDLSPEHIIKSIKKKVSELSHLTGRQYYLIAELDLNDPVFINARDRGGYGVDAQWIDEFHHALRVCAGQKREGYYSDFHGLTDLAKSYRDAYVYDGQFSEHRKKFFGVRTDNPGHQFVVFSQNHDHIGNRMLGERTSQLVSFEMCKLLAGAVMVSPFIPLLFMGEEWAESNPFLFFIDHTDKVLAEAVNKGRKEEFSSFEWAGEPPDPRLRDTFQRSMLQWNSINKPPHHKMLGYYKKLITLRKTLPALRDTRRESVSVEVSEEKKLLTLHRKNDQQHLICVMNFSDERCESGLDHRSLHVLLDSSGAEWDGPVKEPTALPVISGESIVIYERK